MSTLLIGILASTCLNLSNDTTCWQRNPAFPIPILLPLPIKHIIWRRYSLAFVNSWCSQHAVHNASCVTFIDPETDSCYIISNLTPQEAQGYVVGNKTLREHEETHCLGYTHPAATSASSNSQ